MTSRRALAPRDLLREAIASLLMHRLRAALSALGIVAGIATVITALAIGEGARRTALAEIGALGINNILLRSVSAPPRNARERTAAPVLQLDDAVLIGRTLSTVTAVAGSRVGRARLTAGLRHADAAIAGVNTSWAAIFNAELSAGRWLSASDEREGRRVAVIGAALAQTLFTGQNAVGSRVAAAGTWFVIVGTLAPVEDGARRAIARAFDPGQSLIVPLSAMDLSLGHADALDRVHEIAVRIANPADIEPAALALAAIAARRHGQAGYEVIVPRQLLAARLRARRAFDVVLAAVGLLALLISGIGIMNIMLASVAERTHEIGVRRAVGARRGDVLTQFTLEASALCIAGGCAGVPLGLLMAVAVAGAAGWPIGVSGWSVGLAVTLATSVGLAFGIYPARVASRVDPIEALRA